MHARRPSPLALRLLIVPLVLAVLAVGVFVVLKLVSADSDAVAYAAAAAWFLAVSFAFGRLTKGRPDLKLPVRVAILGGAAVLLAFVVKTTYFNDETVDEEVATATAPAEPAEAAERAGRGKAPAERGNVLLSSGSFEAAAHETSGRARLIRRAGGDEVLTLTDFETDSGPDLRVYLTTGDGSDAGDHVDLGGLKGNKGDQQYPIPRGTDLSKYTGVSIWCRAFSVNFGHAALKG